MRPYLIQPLVEEHRRELLRSAEAWRLAHLVQMATPKRRRWIPPLPWRRALVKPARSAVPLSAPYERAHDLNSTDPSLSSNWIEMERALQQWSAAARVAREAPVRVPNDQYVRYQAGYVTWQAARALRRQPDECALKVLAEAIRILRSTIIDAEHLPDSNARFTNAKAYRALAYALGDAVRFRVPERFAEGDRGVAAPRSELEATLSRWEREHPEDRRPSEVRSELSVLLRPAPDDP